MFKMKTSVKFLVLVLLLISISPIIAQDESSPPPAVIDANVFVCIIDGLETNLLDMDISSTAGLVFSRTVNIIVYASPETPVAADIVHIVPDTATGAYRYIENVVLGAETTQGIPQQGSCETQYPELSSLFKTILLPLSPDQGLVLRHPDQIVSYTPNDNLSPFVAAIGVFFVNEASNGFPHFQILRFLDEGGDEVILKFPDLEDDETPVYVVSTQPVIFYTVDAQGFRGQERPLDNAGRFINRLKNSGLNLLSDVLKPGRFRISIRHGERVFYERSGTLNLARGSAFGTYTFSSGMSIYPYDCDSPVSYFRADDYETHGANLYMEENLVPRVDTVNCDNPIAVSEVFPDGRLRVNNSTFYVASWLVSTTPPQQPEQ